MGPPSATHTPQRAPSSSWDRRRQSSAASAFFSHGAEHRLNDQDDPNDALAVRFRKAIQRLKKKSWFRLVRRLFILIAYFILGIIVYSKYENWDADVALFFTIVTITTTGYGDHHPTYDGTRLFTVFYMLFGIYTVALFLSDAASANFHFTSDLLKKNITSTADVGKDYRNNLFMMWAHGLSLVVCVLVGSAVFMSMEDWTFIQALYFTVQSSTTTGYGDMQLRGGYTHLAVGLYLIFSCMLFAFAFQNLQQLHARRRQIRKLEYMLHKRKNLNVLTDLDKGEGVTQEQFVLALLLHFGTINYESDVRPWAERFAALDQAHHGRLFEDDLLQFESEERDGAVEDSEQLEEAQALAPQLRAVSTTLMENVRASFSSNVGDGSSAPLIRPV